MSGHRFRLGIGGLPEGQITSDYSLAITRSRLLARDYSLAITSDYSLDITRSRLLARHYSQTTEYRGQKARCKDVKVRGGELISE